MDTFQVTMAQNQVTIQSMDVFPDSVPSDDLEELGYQNTLMYGRYTRDLGEYAKTEATKIKLLERHRKQEEKARNRELYGKRPRRSLRVLIWIWTNTFARLGEDWVYLALLGIIMALLSYIMDKGISMCTNARVWLYRDLTSDPYEKYFVWISLPVCLMLFAVGFVHLISPQSIGSGIPEMKTILRGVTLKEYLTFKTLVAKFIGLMATLGSGMPLGKESPFVHIASIVAHLLSKLVTSFQAIYENESRHCEMLAAACAVGVASCFAAPIGGVLFSIEVTTTYFAVRNYWRGFFSAVCCATAFWIIAVWFQKDDIVTPIYATNFPSEFTFNPQELFVFAFIGAVSGFLGAFYVWLHRQYVMFMRTNKRINMFLQKNRFLYPGIISLIVSSLLYPLGTGKYIAGELNTHEQIHHLFTNFTWNANELTVEQATIVNYWSTEYTGVFFHLSAYFFYSFIFSIIASTAPVPSGLFIPVFKIGASMGRIVGEALYLNFPLGFQFGDHISQIIPGGYAVVGAAALSASVTHTVSVGVIAFEMTGQITHLVPVMIAVLIANAVAALLQPSLYDSFILIKKLPYLPDLLPSASGMYNIMVEDFMLQDVKFIWPTISYESLKNVLRKNKHLRSLPLVDSPDNMILLGSIKRFELTEMIKKHIGRERRLEVAAKWRKEGDYRARDEYTTQYIRQSSRYDVEQTADVVKLREIANNEMLPPQAKKTKDTLLNLNRDVFPGRSILKKTQSFNFQRHSSPFKVSTTLQNDVLDQKSAENIKNQGEDQLYGISSPNNVATDIISFGPYVLKKVHLPRERIVDMSPEDQKLWEAEELAMPIDLQGANVKIDPSPFQLVEKTSLIKVHSLFSMIGINHAYVTKIGKLVGVVAIKELRKAIEDVNNGNVI